MAMYSLICMFSGLCVSLGLSSRPLPVAGWGRRERGSGQNVAMTLVASQDILGTTTRKVVASYRPLHPRRNKFRLFRFFCAKNQSLASLFLLFRKKARSAYLFVCKRTHDGSLSLPPFYEYAFGVVSSKSFCSSKKSWMQKCSGFLLFASSLFTFH